MENMESLGTEYLKRDIKKEMEKTCGEEGPRRWLVTEDGGSFNIVPKMEQNDDQCESSSSATYVSNQQNKQKEPDIGESTVPCSAISALMPQAYGIPVVLDKQQPVPDKQPVCPAPKQNKKNLKKPANRQHKILPAPVLTSQLSNSHGMLQTNIIDNLCSQPGANALQNLCLLVNQNNHPTVLNAATNLPMLNIPAGFEPVMPIIDEKTKRPQGFKVQKTKNPHKQNTFVVDYNKGTINPLLMDVPLNPPKQLKSASLSAMDKHPHVNTNAPQSSNSMMTTWYRCFECGELFHFESEVEDHRIRNGHMVRKPDRHIEMIPSSSLTRVNKCNLCGKLFKEMFDYNLHKRHHNPDEHHDQESMQAHLLHESRKKTLNTMKQHSIPETLQNKALSDTQSVNQTNTDSPKLIQQIVVKKNGKRILVCDFDKINSSESKKQKIATDVPQDDECLITSSSKSADVILCEDCGLPFKDAASLCSHLYDVHGKVQSTLKDSNDENGDQDNTLIHTCQFCAQGLLTFTDLGEHEQNCIHNISLINDVGDVKIKLEPLSTEDIKVEAENEVESEFENLPGPSSNQTALNISTDTNTHGNLDDDNNQSTSKSPFCLGLVNINDNKEAIMTLMKMLYWLVKEDIPESKIQSFAGLIDSMNNSSLSPLMKKDGKLCVEKDSIEQLQYVMAKVITSDMEEKLSLPLPKSVFLLEDWSNNSYRKLCLYVISLDPDTFKPMTHYIGNVYAHDGKASTLSGEMINALKTKNVDLDNINSFGSAGANLMTVADNGVGDQFKRRTNNKLIQLHCFPDSLTFATSQAAIYVPVMADFQKLLTELNSFFSHPFPFGKIPSGVQVLQKEFSVQNKDMCLGRWLSVIPVIESLFVSWVALVSFLKEEQIRDQHYSDKAKVLAIKLCTYSNVAALHFMMDVVSHLKNLSQTIGNFNRLSSVSFAVINTKMIFQEMKMGRRLSYFNKFKNDVYTSNNVKGHVIQGEHVQTSFQTETAKFLNHLIQNIDRRFSPESSKVVKALGVLQFKPLTFSFTDLLKESVSEQLRWGTEEICELSQHYDMDVYKLLEEWKDLKLFIISKGCPPNEMFWRDIYRFHQDEFPCLLWLAATALTLPLNPVGVECREDKGVIKMGPQIQRFDFMKAFYLLYNSV